MAIIKNKYTLALVASLTSLSFIFYTPSSTKTAAKSDNPKTLPSVVAKKKITAPYIYKDTNPYLNQVLFEYESFIKRAIENNLAPGAAVAIIKDTSVIYLKGFGLRDVRTQESIDVHSVFRIGSVSKSFASVLTGVLVDDQKLSWGDSVQHYLPAFKLQTEEATKNLTIRHVLSHTIGLPYHAYTDRVDDGANFDTLVYHLRDVALIGKPGQFYSYQNVGYSLIAKVIESATGKTYEENMKEKLFSPLQMQTASLSFADIINNDNVAKPHRYGKGWKSVSISDTYYNVGPAGGVNASISDMAKWLLAITDGSHQLMKEETSDELFNPTIRATAKNHNFWRWKRLKSAYYAMGWRVLNFKEDTLVYHGGYVNGYRSEVAIHRKNKIAICVLVNAPGNLADISIPKFFELFGKQKEAIASWEKIRVEPLARK